MANQTYKNTRFFSYFNMLAAEQKYLKQQGIYVLFVQTPVKERIQMFTDFENERLSNWIFDFNNISEKDAEILKDIYGNDVSTDDIIKLYDGARVYENKGIKHLADFKGEYVNIVGGKRITLNQPKTFCNRIHMYGQCTLRGTGVSDKDTIASILQKNVNETFPNLFKVENHAIGCGSDLLDDLAHLKNTRLYSGDIIIFCTNLEVLPCQLFYDASIDYFDSSVLFSGAKNKSEWFSDETYHTNAMGNRCIAVGIYNYLLEKSALAGKVCGEKHCVQNDVDTADGFSDYAEEIERYACFLRQFRKSGTKAGSIVMNCNPFTKGHQYLIEFAAKQVQHLYIFVLEEDKSFFSFQERMKMVSAGTEHLGNITVIPSGNMIISAITFPGYFNKDNIQDIVIDTTFDIDIFGKFIAPVLNISIRFAGEEPYDYITKQYNETMKERLPQYGIEFMEIQRIKVDQRAISASRVRTLLREKKWSELETLLPDTTMKYLKESGIYDN